MRKKEQEITNRSEIDGIIRESKICRLALCDGDKPYIVPVNFGYKNNSLYIHSAPEGKKIDIIKKNPNICFEFDLLHEIVEADKACNWSIRYKSVIGYGLAYLVENNEDKIDALKILMNQYSEKPFTFSENSVKKTAIIKIFINNLYGKKSGY